MLRGQRCPYSGSVTCSLAGGASTSILETVGRDPVGADPARGWPRSAVVHHFHVDQASALQVSVLLITGTVGAGKTAVAREIGELLRLN